MAPNLAVSTYELTQNIINSKLQGGVGVQNEEGEFERNLRRVWDLGRSEISEGVAGEGGEGSVDGDYEEVYCGGS
jgi:hypothetical protein